MNNFLKIHGCFEQKIYKIVDGKKHLVEDYIDPNLVVNLGKEKVVKLLANETAGNYITSISFGTATNRPTVGDIAITDAFTKNVSGYSFPSTTSVKFDWTLLTTEANGKAITEYGLLTQDGSLFSRKVRGVINKEADVLINGSWTITII